MQIIKIKKTVFTSMFSDFTKIKITSHTILIRFNRPNYAIYKK